MKARQHILALTLALAASCAGARAGTIIFEANGTLERISGTDVLGLDGAAFSLRVGFDASQAYHSEYDIATARSISDHLTLTGSTTPGVDGTYSSSSGILFHPGYGGQFYGGPTGGGFVDWVVAGQPVLLGYFTTPPFARQIGDPIRLEDFGTTLDPTDAKLYYMGGQLNASYRIRGFQASATLSAVPEPSAIVSAAIALTSAACVFARRRARSS